MQNKLQVLQEMIDTSNRIVFLGGAGVSTASGIPDFRSANGLYKQQQQYDPETMLSHTFFRQHTEEFYDYYKKNLLRLDVKPNIAHYKLAELEAKGKLKAIVTQNIDGLHQAAGSKNVYEIHGSIHRNTCTQCGKQYSAEYVKHSNGVPVCSVCGAVVKPDVVLYEEQLPQDVLGDACEWVGVADMLIVAGTSLSVYPANSLVYRYYGDKLVIINKTPTEKDHKANLIIRAGIGDVLDNIRI